jgi:gamma-glutamyl hercynylcysteine S-oxide synthase
MATRALKNSPLPRDAAQVLRALGTARERTLALVSELDDEQLERVHSPIMSPLVWDLAHIAAY